MRFVICVTCGALLTLAVMVTGAPLTSGTSKPKPQYDLDNASALFEKFVKDFDKTYKDEQDKKIHYGAFVESLKLINQLNSDPKQRDTTFDINQFADFTEGEHKQMSGLIMPY